MKPTIAHVAGYYPPHMGGMEKVAQSLAEQLADRNYDVRVLTSSVGQPATPSAPRRNLQIIRMKAFEFAHTPWAPGLPRRLFSLPRTTLLHLHLAQAMYPEWVWFVAKLRKQPYIVHFHLDLQPSGPLGMLFLAYKSTLMSGAIRNANKVVVFSEEQQQLVHNKYGLPLKNVVVVPNGVGDEFFRSARKYRAHKQFELLYVGRLAPQKRLDRLVDALAHTTVPVRLTIVGDGENRKELEQQVAALNLKNVVFVGSKTSEEVRSYHEKADAFVITSDREGMPLVVLEAMAAALPVIGTDVPGVRELVGGVGVLTDCSPSAIASAIDNTFDPNKLESLSVQSLRTAKKYAWPHIIDAFEALYKEVWHEAKS